MRGHQEQAALQKIEQAAADGGPLPPLTVCGNELTLFLESRPLIRQLIADMRAAGERIWLECYIFTNDEAGEAVADTLIDRAADGLDVRLIYDPVGSHATPGAFFERLQAGGVQVHAYHTLRDTFLRFSPRAFNRRDHRRLFLIDDAIGYFGGMNLVDPRSPAPPGKERVHRKSASWRDVHVRLAGPKQAELVQAFEFLWRRVHHLKPRLQPVWQINELRRATGEGILFFDSDPRVRWRRPSRVLASLFRQARESITISMAYFIPQGRVLREMVRASRRGVRVRVIVPAESDVPLVQWATEHFYAYLLRRGIEVFERSDRMLHSKVIVIDGWWSAVGSCNLDPRSLWTNLEFFGIVRSTPFAHVIERICEYEIRHSEQVTRAHVRRRPWWKRLVGTVAWSVRRWL